MVDLLNNEIHIGDKVAFPIARSDRKELDYGIVKKLTKNKTSCWCKSFNYETPEILRKSYQIVKIS